jgi:tetratricopeptide (TPR) repeat protein
VPTLRRLAALYESLGDDGHAAEIYEALATEPALGDGARADAWYRAGEHHRRGDARGEAERCYLAALQIVADHMPCLDALERLALDAQDHARVAIVLGKKVAATQRHPNRQKALLARLADLYEHGLGRPDVALETWRRALEVDPDFRPALRQIAGVQLARGDADAFASQLALARVLPGDGDLSDSAAALAVERTTAAITAAGLAGQLASADAVARVAEVIEPLVLKHAQPDALLAALEDAHRGAGELARAVELIGRRLASADAVGGDDDDARAHRVELECRRIDTLLALGERTAAFDAAESAFARMPESDELARRRQALAASDQATEAAAIASAPRPGAGQLELAATRRSIDAALAEGRPIAAAAELDGLLARLDADGKGHGATTGELWLELADVCFDRLGDAPRGRIAMRRAAEAFGGGVRREGVLRLLASEAATAGAHADAADALEAIDPSRLTAVDRLALARAQQKLGRERRALEVLEAGRRAGTLSDEGALLLFALHRRRRVAGELAATLERGGRAGPPEVVATRLAVALEIVRDSLGDDDGVARLGAALAGLGADPTRPPTVAELVRAAEADDAVAADLFRRALLARLAAPGGPAGEPSTLALIDRVRAAAIAAKSYEPLASSLEALAAVSPPAQAAELLAEAGRTAARELGDPPRASDLLTRALALDPERADLAAALSDVLAILGATVQRLAAWEHHAAATRGEPRARALVQLARLQRDELGDRLAARRSLDEALGLAPGLSAELAAELDALDPRTTERTAAVADPGEGAGPTDAPAAFDAPTRVGDPNAVFDAVTRVGVPSPIADAPTTPVPAPRPRRSSTGQEASTAQNLENRGHVDAAIAQLEATWIADPDDRRPLEQLERLYRVTGDADALSETLGRLITLTPERKARAVLWHRRARLYRDVLAREPEAYRCLKEAFANDPDSGDIAHSLRYLAIARGEWGLAAELVYREIAAAANDHDRAALYLELALIYDEKLADPNQALANYEQALLLDPTIPAAPRPLARLYLGARRPAEAAAMFERAAGHAIDDADKGRLYRLGAQAADQALLPDESQRLARLADAVQAQGGANTAPINAAVATARLAALEERLRLTAAGDEKDALRRQVLALALELGDRESVERHASALVAHNRADMSAYSSLTSEASERGNWPAMASLLQRRIERAADDAERAALYVELGRLQARELEDLDAATASFEQALADDPALPEALEGLADIAYQRQDWLRAKDLYARVDPERAGMPADVVYFRRGEVAEVLGDDVEATRAFARSVELFPGNRPALTALARSALRAGDIARAYEASRALLDLLPPDDVRAVRAARLQLAELSQRIGDLDGAVRCYEQALAEEPRSITALTSLIQLHGERGDYAAAASMLQSLIALTPAPTQRADLLFRLGELHRRNLGAEETAADCYLKAIDLDPDNVPTLRRLLDVYWHQRDDKSLLEVAADLDDRGALLEASTGALTLSRTMWIAALRGQADRAAQLAALLGAGAVGVVAESAAELVERPDVPAAGDLAGTLLVLALRAGIARPALAAELDRLAADRVALKPLARALGDA